MLDYRVAQEHPPTQPPGRNTCETTLLSNRSSDTCEREVELIVRTIVRTTEGLKTFKFKK